MRAKAKDWGTKLVGKATWVKSLGPSYLMENYGTLCGYTTDGNGNITILRVAFTPGDCQDFDANDVELAS